MKKNQIALRIYTRTQKNMESKKIKFVENVEKNKNIPIKGTRK